MIDLDNIVLDHERVITLNDDSEILMEDNTEYVYTDEQQKEYRMNIVAVKKIDGEIKVTRSVVLPGGPEHVISIGMKEFRRSVKIANVTSFAKAGNDD